MFARSVYIRLKPNSIAEFNWALENVILPPSCAEQAARSRSLPAPSAGAPSTSLPHRRSCRCRTRTLFGSLQIAPPLLSNPTSSSARGLRPTKDTRSLGGWAKTNCRSGPVQNTEITATGGGGADRCNTSRWRLAGRAPNRGSSWRQH